LQTLQSDAHLLIDGTFVPSKSDSWIPVKNPATQDVVNSVPECTPQEFDAAVASAKAAFPAWHATPVSKRQRVMFAFADLIRKHSDELAAAITLEQGKTISDAHGDVFRGLEVCPWHERLCHSFKHTCLIIVLLTRHSSH
jgi:malonate-semialdehyde dehydrogenase (acetylating)/methylmalonate-semialdehyde dehydrogenase